MNFKKQIEAIYGILISPKRTILELPSKKICLIAVLLHIYFSFSRSFQPQRYEKLLDFFGGNTQIVIFTLLIAVIFIPLGAWLMQLIIKIFGKKLSIYKLINIFGYAYVPRFIVAIIGYVLLFANPNMFEENSLSPSINFILIIGFAGMIYSIVLSFYGIVISPSENSGNPSVNSEKSIN